MIQIKPVRVKTQATMEEMEKDRGRVEQQGDRVVLPIKKELMHLQRKVFIKFQKLI